MNKGIKETIDWLNVKEFSMLDERLLKEYPDIPA